MKRVASARNRTKALIVGVLLAGPFYLLLIDTVSTPELVALGCAVALAAVTFELAYAEGAGHASYRISWLARAGRAAIDVPRQILIVCAEIVSQARSPRPARGCVRAVCFRAGAGSPADHGRRALAEALGSIAPNTIVIGVDEAADVLLVHQLRRDGGSEQLDPLGMGSAGSDG